MKKVLVLCTGNSCRSIIAEALINSELDFVEAKSSGVKPSGKVNPYAKRLLQQKKIWKDEYYSKELETLKEENFDLIVTVCDHAHENCPVFPAKIPVLHVGFEDPDGKGFEAFEQTFQEIKTKLLPKILENLDLQNSRMDRK